MHVEVKSTNSIHVNRIGDILTKRINHDIYKKKLSHADRTEDAMFLGIASTFQFKTLLRNVLRRGLGETTGLYL
jgi:hypothetical protein